MTNLPQNQKVVESTKKKKEKKRKKRKKELERKETHAIKWNDRWWTNKYHEMTPFIVLKCNKNRVHEIFLEAATGCVL